MTHLDFTKGVDTVSRDELRKIMAQVDFLNNIY